MNHVLLMLLTKTRDSLEVRKSHKSSDNKKLYIDTDYHIFSYTLHTWSQNQLLKIVVYNICERYGKNSFCWLQTKVEVKFAGDSHGVQLRADSTPQLLLLRYILQGKIFFFFFFYICLWKTSCVLYTRAGCIWKKYSHNLSHCSQHNASTKQKWTEDKDCIQWEICKELFK